MNKKILIMNAGFHISGVTRALVNLANALDESGHQVTIKTFTDDKGFEHLLNPTVKRELLLAEPRLFGKRIKGFLRYYYKKVAKIFKMSPEQQYCKFVDKQYDVEIAFNRGVPARVISASTNANAIKLCWVHNDYMLCDNPLSGFDTLRDAFDAYKKFDKVVCVSEQSRISFVKKFNIKENVISLPNIIDEEYLRSSQEAIDVCKRCFTLVAIGRLCEQKAYDIMLNACKKLNEDGFEYELWIIGDGEGKENLLKLKNSLELTNVKFLGEKSNPYSYFKLADLYVCSSTYEGLSTTTIESLIMGVPAVVTDCTGMRDILGDSEYGLIVPIDVDSLYNGIKCMVENRDIRNMYREKCLIRAKDFYKSKTISKIESLISNN